MRVGTGFDMHRLVAGRDLILGGVAIPGPVARFELQEARGIERLARAVGLVVV